MEKLLKLLLVLLGIGLGLAAAQLGLALYRLNHQISATWIPVAAYTGMAILGGVILLLLSRRIIKDSPKEPGKVIFNYVNNDGRKFVNAFKFKSIDTKSESISLTQGTANTLTFQGKKANEYDRFYLRLKRDGQEDVEVEASEADGNELTFAADDLSSLAKGTFDAQLVRRTEGTNVKAADRGGFWNAEYASVLKKVTIK